MRRELQYECPDCQYKLAPVDAMGAATQVVRRWCGGCRQRWQIVITPRVSGGVAVGTGEFTRLAGHVRVDKSTPDAEAKIRAAFAAGRQLRARTNLSGRFSWLPIASFRVEPGFGGAPVWWVRVTGKVRSPLTRWATAVEWFE